MRRKELKEIEGINLGGEVELVEISISLVLFRQGRGEEQMIPRFYWDPKLNRCAQVLYKGRANPFSPSILGKKDFNDYSLLSPLSSKERKVKWANGMDSLLR
jgi:hypothetical protein